MTWTTPTTNRSTGYTPTSTDYAALVNNLKFLQYMGGKGQTLAFHNTTGIGAHDPVTVGSGAWTRLPVYNVADATWRTSTALLSTSTGSTGVFTIPAGGEGVWGFDYWCSFEQWAPGFVNTHWTGSQIVHTPASTTVTASTMRLAWNHPVIQGPSPIVHSGSWMFYCTTGDTVELKVRQDSSGNRFAIGSLHGRWLSGGAASRPAYSEVSIPAARTTETAARWNTIQGNLKYLHDPPWCWAKLDVSQSHTTGTWELIGFDDTDVYDPAGMHDEVSDYDRFYVPDAGVYMVNLLVGYDANADFDGERGLKVERWTDRGDGTYVRCGDTRYDLYPVSLGGISPHSALYGYTLAGSGQIYCRADDYLMFYASQASGSTLTLSAAEAQVIHMGLIRNIEYGDNLGAPPDAGYVTA